MSDVLTFGITGLGQGAVFAALALSLVITYKGTGVINFAAGVMGAWSAFTFSELQATGRLVLPIGSIGLGDTVGTVAAVLISVVIGLGVGLISHLLVFRPLRKAPPLAKIVASVGLMLTLQSLANLRFGVGNRIVEPIFPNETITIGDSAGIPRDRLWITAVVVLLCVLAAAWFRMSRSGLAIRAAAENERFASFAGLAPERLAATAWAISSSIIAFVAVLAAPVVGLSSTKFTFFIVPALACALVGRLSSIGTAVAAGLSLGAINSLVTFYSGKDWWPEWATTGVSSAIPFVAIVAMLFLRGKSIPTRDAVVSGRLPEVVRPRLRPVVASSLFAAAVIVVAVTGGSYRFGVIISMAVAVIALSFVVLTGYLGQVSLAQAAFAGVAGFVLSKLATNWDVPFPLAPLGAAIVAGVFGVIAGIPALRVRGVQLAVLTLSLALAFESLVLENNVLNEGSGNRIPPPELFGLNLSIREGTNTARWQYGVLVLVVLFAAALVVANLARSSTGNRFLAVRSNERASASVGIDVTRTKLFAFALSAFLAGIGGSLIGYSQGSVSATSYATLIGLTWLVFAYLGGISSIGGAVIAGLFVPLGLTFVIVDRLIGASGQTYQLVAAIGLIVTAIQNPEGIAGGMRQTASAITRRFTKADPCPSSFQEEPPAKQSAVATELTPAPARRRTTPERTILETRDLTVTFGIVRAVQHVNVKVGSGQIVGLIGANGAGKTTFIDAVSGFVSSAGAVRLVGERVDELPAYQRARRGLARTWQSLELFDDLDVAENLEVASSHGTMKDALIDLVRPGRSIRSEHVDHCLDLLGLRDVAHAKPRSLPLGRQKLLNVARALVSDPHLLLLDEPAAGLSTSETQALGRLLTSLVADSDLGILLVEHDVELVFDVCDYVYVLDRGIIIAEGPPDAVRDDRKIIEAYLGSAPTADEHHPSTEAATYAPIGARP